MIGQAITETWRTLSEGKMGDNNQPIISMTTFYTGFIRRDNRGWLGFHDGISNMNEEQRKIAISIGAAQVNANDDWIISGTFMAFIRIVIDLPNWWKLPLREQELMIGRDKTTGCPIIGIDKNNIPLKDKRCPVTGSKEVTDKGNEIFRDHPAYGQQKLPAGISDDVLKTSHIGAMRILDKVSPWEENQTEYTGRVTNFWNLHLHSRD